MLTYLTTDVKAPVFIDGECPKDIQTTIDSANNTAKVTWLIPSGIDHSGETPTVKEENGYVPGQRFTAGCHIVKYTIRDSAGNQGSTCSFIINVQCKWNACFGCYCSKFNKFHKILSCVNMA